MDTVTRLEQQPRYRPTPDQRHVGEPIGAPRLDPRDGGPVAWYWLIREANALIRASGWGLQSLWWRIEAGDYPTARRRLDQLTRQWETERDADAA